VKEDKQKIMDEIRRLFHELNKLDIKNKNESRKWNRQKADELIIKIRALAERWNEEKSNK
jgi:hypothetical protein